MSKAIVSQAKRKQEQCERTSFGASLAAFRALPPKEREKRLRVLRALAEMLARRG